MQTARFCVASVLSDCLDGKNTTPNRTNCVLKDEGGASIQNGEEDAWAQRTPKNTVVEWPLRRWPQRTNAQTNWSQIHRPIPSCFASATVSLWCDCDLGLTLIISSILYGRGWTRNRLILLKLTSVPLLSVQFNSCWKKTTGWTVLCGIIVLSLRHLKNNIVSQSFKCLCFNQWFCEQNSSYEQLCLSLEAQSAIVCG